MFVIYNHILNLAQPHVFYDEGFAITCKDESVAYCARNKYECNLEVMSLNSAILLMSDEQIKRKNILKTLKSFSV